MQGNGFKIFALLAFVGLSFYYLYPTAQNHFQERNLASMSQEEADQYHQQNYDRIQRTRERALKLGLDLQGGMHVTLEVRMESLLRELAASTDEVFDQALIAAGQRAETENVSFVNLFMQELQQRESDVQLSRYYRNPNENITRRSSNSEVLAYLNREGDDAIDRAVEIIRQRVDRFGVSEPSIQKQGSRRIAVELPGVDEPERVRNLLRGTARLEFRLMADPADLQRSLGQVLSYYDQTSAQETAPVDTTADATTANPDAADAVAVDTATTVDELLGTAPPATADTSGNPLEGIFQPIGEGTVFGAVAERDTARVRALLEAPQVRGMLPGNTRLMYTARAEGRTEQGEPVYFMLGVRGGRAEMTGEVITDARPDFMPMTNAPIVSLTMNSEGSQRWSRITGANIDRQVAVVLDGVVYTYPVIRSRITGGRTQIEGISASEARDIVTVLKSGALPAPVDIVEERTVGPSLGAASVRAGTISVIVGLMLVALFMVFYYRTFGLIANLALLLNIVFIFGILAAFGATLTLPGIAGIVLTIGMAVDANVLIFDRIREEMTAGKTLKASIDGGYGKALSAIADANITTFLTGVILYSFGVGPIQGFAVTLMAGIISSLFTAIVVTRIVVDYLIVGRRTALSIG